MGLKPFGTELAALGRKATDFLMSEHITPTGSTERRLNSKTNPVIVAPRSSNQVWHDPVVTENGLEPQCGSRVAEFYRIESRDILETRSRVTACRKCFDRANFNCPECNRPTLVEATDEIVDWKCESCGHRVREANDE